MTHEVSAQTAWNLLFAGKCELVFFNTKTNQRRTYIVSRVRRPLTSAEVYYVYVHGSFIGTILVTDSNVVFKAKVPVTEREREICIEFSSVIHRMRIVVRDGAKWWDEIIIYHTGTCAKCGKKLTDKISIDRGLGSYCYNSVSKRVSSDVSSG